MSFNFTPRQNFSSPQHLILWDGDCGFCRRGVAWMMARDRRKKFRAMPYQDAPSPPMNAALKAACAHAVHVLTTDGRVLGGAAATLFILENLGCKRAARLLSTPLLMPLCDVAYKIVARHRLFFSRFFFRPESGECEYSACGARDE